MSETLDKKIVQSKYNKYESIIDGNKADILGLKENICRKEST